jgi:hypothetical protein
MRFVDSIVHAFPPPLGLPQLSACLATTWPAFNRCSPFFPLFRHPARRPDDGKEGRTVKEGHWAAPVVVKHALPRGRPGGGGAKSTDCTVPGPAVAGLNRLTTCRFGESAESAG